MLHALRIRLGCRHCGSHVEPEDPLSDQPPHELPEEARHRLGEEAFDQMFSFAIFRNPFARVLSQYRHRMRINYQGIRSLDLDFDQFVYRAYGLADPRLTGGEDRLFMPCDQWVTSPRGDLLVSQIFFFEDGLGTIWEYVKGQTGITEPAEIPHLNQSGEPASLRQYYTMTSRRIISEMFEADLRRYDQMRPKMPIRSLV